MANLKQTLLELDVDKLFEEHSVDEIVKFEKLLNSEIEKKRTELRGMVGDRYKDVLIASDAIKSMKSISQEIVNNIQNISIRFEDVITDATLDFKPVSVVVDSKTINERTVIMQIRLAMIVNNHVWMALEEENFSNAAQMYLLAQHISTGLQLLNKDILERLLILKRIKADLDILRQRILKRTKEKLENIELNVEETANYLNALMLLEPFHSSSDLLNVFIKLRKSALNKVINGSHSSVRIQIVSMIKSLITTVYLLHECFINYENTQPGLIWKLLEEIVSENTPATISKIALPTTPLVIYVPDLIRQYRPKQVIKNCKFNIDNKAEIMGNWLQSTLSDIEKELKIALKSITNIKALHAIREEAFKIELPNNWNNICKNLNFPQHFNIWFYFFQKFITERVKVITSSTVSTNFNNLKLLISETLEDAVIAKNTEDDLRWYTWNENDSDVDRVNNNHLGLSMKTKAYSPNVMILCKELDTKCKNLFDDLSLYLYISSSIRNNEYIMEGSPVTKYADKGILEQYLKKECSSVFQRLAVYLEETIKLENNLKSFVIKSLLCARFLQAIGELCPNFKKCCACDGEYNEWEQIQNILNIYSVEFWKNWMNICIKEVIINKEKYSGSVADVLDLLPRWESREIQEQTDEKVFKSQIKVPSQPSLLLERILFQLITQLNNIIPHTIPKQIHADYMYINISNILEYYKNLASLDINQIQALQFLFDVKFVTTFCIPRENLQLISMSQSISDSLRSKVDPFDLDVFHGYLQQNVKSCVIQSQVILGCLLPNSGHLANLDVLLKNKDFEKEPSILPVSSPATSSWFPLLPASAPSQKPIQLATTPVIDVKINDTHTNFVDSVKKSTSSVNTVRSGAAAFFGAMTNDWFS